jgi:hypothetical protein
MLYTSAQSTNRSNSHKFEQKHPSPAPPRCRDQQPTYPWPRREYWAAAACENRIKTHHVQTHISTETIQIMQFGAAPSPRISNNADISTRYIHGHGGKNGQLQHLKHHNAPKTIIVQCRLHTWCWHADISTEWGAADAKEVTKGWGLVIGRDL